MTNIAHIRKIDKQIQTIEEHLLEVKELAESFGDKIGVRHIAGLAGMLHDMGKYTKEFSNYIKAAVFHPETAPARGTVDHSTAGGKLLYDLYHTKNIKEIPARLAEIVGNAIISHHSYLKDFLNENLESPYLKRVQKSDLEEYPRTKAMFFKSVISEADFADYVEKATKELKIFLEKDKTKTTEQKCMFLTKFIFSALIDADRTNTRLFEENKSHIPPDNRKQLFKSYYEKLMKKNNSFLNHKDANTPINVLRRKMSEHCEVFAKKPSGIYTLSIPTGGGKTLASLRYALKHAQEFNKKQIIYVVPFTTIIEQNAEEVRKILKDDGNVLEHHSNVIIDIDENDEDENHDGIMCIKEKLKLAKDNWDSPIIFTTMVQFLDTFYAKGSRNIRRLHNLSEAVIIFDEVQKVPVSCISLFNSALNFLKTYGNSSIVLCTATQPALDFVEYQLEISPEAEMIENIDDVITSFKRVEIIDRATQESFNNDRLAVFVEEQLETRNSILIILNTKAVVKDLFEKLSSQLAGIPIYHLSTSMCAAHRNKIIEEVRIRLKNKDPIICISTQLIEAGVDVSFSCVIRSLAGLDSIAQAAGRCNRHGELEIGRVYIIDHEEEKLSKLREIEVGKQLTKIILKDLQMDPCSHGGHLLSQDAMRNYFQGYYNGLSTRSNYYVKKLDNYQTNLLMQKRSENNYCKAYRHQNKKELPLFLANSYGTAAQYFQVIEHETTTALVPFEEGEDIIADLNGDETIEELGNLLKRSQQFSVNLYKHELDELERNGGLETVFDGQIFVLKKGAYNEKYGVDIKNESGAGGYFF
ncbi:CRISPR-associated helicase Cas3' [Bacillus sp. HMF5848]|uniref:CRISPR-associated helicase Cas3' n=1 Tax=Bacillus sp. HMF5848 TaxID=2495421 RepID=UPI000F76A15D|nr:CRISPR-associated helicase Cas3' [Bacillus sp. HMF5848]RSK26543.1 CRISPR-associated helicase Cas3' [Bacillus sp. HMF5848]